jgi:hypothetical protein
MTCKIDESEGVGHAVEPREIQLLEPWVPVLMVLPRGGLDAEDVVGVGCDASRRWIASRFVSTAACSDLIVALRVSSVAWRAASLALLSPMVVARCGVGREEAG